MVARKPNKYHVLLLVTEHEDEQQLTSKALEAAGYDADQLVTEDADRAMDFLYARGEYADGRPPSLIVIDLDHTTGEARQRLSNVLEEVKAHHHFHLIPVIVILREADPEYVLSWYQAGIHACVFRPDNLEQMTQMFSSIRSYWSTRVILPDLE